MKPPVGGFIAGTSFPPVCAWPTGGSFASAAQAARQISLNIGHRFQPHRNT